MSNPPSYPDQGYVFTPEEEEILAATSSQRMLDTAKSVGNNILIAGIAGTSMAIEAAGKAKEAGSPLLDKGKHAAEKGKEYAQKKGKELADRAKEEVIPMIDKGKVLAKEKGGPMFQESCETVKQCLSSAKGAVENYCDKFNDVIETAKQSTLIPARKWLATSFAWWLESRAGNLNFQKFVDALQPGCVIQLVSRTSGGTVQIVMKDMQMILDARGPLDARALNSLWTVAQGSNPNQIRLHNYNNFINVADDQSKIIHVQAGTTPGQQTDIIVHQYSILVSLEFASQPGSWLGFFKTGELRSVTEGADEESNYFGVKLVKKA